MKSYRSRLSPSLTAFIFLFMIYMSTSLIMCLYFPILRFFMWVLIFFKLFFLFLNFRFLLVVELFQMGNINFILITNGLRSDKMTANGWFFKWENVMVILILYLLWVIWSQIKWQLMVDLWNYRMFCLIVQISFDATFLYLGDTWRPVYRRRFERVLTTCLHFFWQISSQLTTFSPLPSCHL